MQNNPTEWSVFKYTLNLEAQGWSTQRQGNTVSVHHGAISRAPVDLRQVSYTSKDSIRYECWGQDWICKTLVTYSFVKYWNKTYMNYWETTNHTFPPFDVLFPDIPAYSSGLWSSKSVQKDLTLAHAWNEPLSFQVSFPQWISRCTETSRKTVVWGSVSFLIKKDMKYILPLWCV